MRPALPSSHLSRSSNLALASVISTEYLNPSACHKQIICRNLLAYESRLQLGDVGRRPSPADTTTSRPAGPSTVMAFPIATTPLVPSEHGIQLLLRHVVPIVSSSSSPTRRDSDPSDNMGLGSHGLDVNSLFTNQQKLAIQYASASVACLSLVATLVSLYWFAIMARNFRRTLVLLLLTADMFKSLWFFVFPAVSLSVGGIASGSAFCHVGGFFLQAGLESCANPTPDLAILLMSLHMSLQIFNPTSTWFGPDGLYRVRYAVYVVWIVLPCFMAALAFINKAGGYLSQGAFCTLPIRPFWYRLALSWIPRYLVWLYVTVTAMRIYVRVGAGFSVFARKIESSSDGSNQSRPSTSDQVKRLVKPKLHRNLPSLQIPFSTNSTISRSASTGDFNLDLSKTTPTSEPGRELSGDTLHPVSAAGRQDPELANDASTSADLGAAEIVDGENGAQLVQITSTAEATQKSRRRAIQRQTRLLFIYPCTYMILMVIPFLQHCFNYSDYYAQHPIFAISLLGPCCLSVMGFVDCCIFCWRETPWKNIPGSDGTVLGSFKFWQIMGTHSQSHTANEATSGEFQRAMIQIHQQSNSVSRNVSTAQGMVPGSYFSAIQEDRPSSSGSGARKFLETIKVKRPPPRRVFSGASDRAALQADYAAERLALERAAAAHAREHSTYTVAENNASPTKTKDWFDRRESWLDDLGSDEDDDEKRKMSVASGRLAVGKTRDMEKEHERMKRDFGAL
ncbi:hypothetical protein K461DRAFT_315839 [Myriangium duriaei CBS 260.36]|uniref:G-protein coupled receptors family 1 profile domain-containing protein n=1 Tax=Myriangium duriaei CBS 260.36 TaxID=1168546 RepID=A0A9P4IUT6_9PEZI|nr:hypothetical protein K461DRAFT_315839 [Myriangium duriaei CBS 260.36]